MGKRDFNIEKAKRKRKKGLMSMLGIHSSDNEEEKKEEIVKVVEKVAEEPKHSSSTDSSEFEVETDFNSGWSATSKTAPPNMVNKDKVYPPLKQEKETKPYTKSTIGFPRTAKADITIACIQLTDSIDQIWNFVNASLMFYGTKFYKFIFFSNNIYSSEVIQKADITKEKITNMIKTQKELEILGGVGNILLYDAIEETFSLTKEEAVFEKEDTFGIKTKYKLENEKYLFVISGDEIGSSVTKEELQKSLQKARDKSTDIHVVLTNSSNLTKISSLGFRSIKPY